MPSTSTLSIAVLTTDTLHHRYFLQEFSDSISPFGQVVLSVFEEKQYPWEGNAKKWFRKRFPNIWNGLIFNPYLQPRCFRLRENNYERSRFFPDGQTGLPDGIPCISVSSVNNEETRSALHQMAPDLIYVYGTGLVRPETFNLSSLCTVNAHGGKIPGYRGLDTNLWAVLEGHPEDMTVTLHEVDESLDTGSVFLERSIGTPPDLSIYSLRYYTTLIAVEMFTTLTHMFHQGTAYPTPQDNVHSLYYGRMPWLQKLRANQILHAYVTKNKTTDNLL